MTAVIHARSPVERAAWLRQVIKSSVKSASAIKAAVYLADCCNSTTGQCNPSRSRIERECTMSKTNSRRALRELEEAGLIEVDAEGFGPYAYRNKTNQYFLLLRAEDNQSGGGDDEQDENKGDLGVSQLTQGGVTADIEGVSQLTQGGVAADIEGMSQLTPKPSSKPKTETSIEPATEPGMAGAPEPSPESGLIPEDWRPSPAGVDIALRSGMDNKEVERQVPLFVSYNLDTRKVASNWSRYWLSWVTNWERHRVDKLKEEPSGDKHTDSIKRAIKTDKPCWERYGSSGRTPERDAAGFVRSGCSMFGGCMCSQEQRQEIVNRTVPLKFAAMGTEHQPTNSRY